MSDDWLGLVLVVGLLGVFLLGCVLDSRTSAPLEPDVPPVPDHVHFTATARPFDWEKD